jgi:hypothetical protein
MLVSHIGGQHQGPASLRLHRGGDCLERSRVTGRKHDCGARGGKAIAVAAPIPRLAPVTTATRSVKSIRGTI